MPTLLLWKERELKKMRREMDSLVDCFYRDFSVRPIPVPEQPRFHFLEEKHSLIVRGLLSRVDPHTLEVMVSEDYLYVRAGGHSGMPIEKGSVNSSKIKLPCTIDPDKVEASFINHVLEVVMPKWKGERLRKVHIQIR